MGSAKSLILQEQTIGSPRGTPAEDAANTAAADHSTSAVAPRQAVLVFGGLRAELSAALAQRGGGTAIGLEELVGLARQRQDSVSASRLQEALSRPDSLVPFKVALPLLLRLLHTAKPPYILSGFVRTAANVKDLQASAVGQLRLAVQAGEAAGIADRALINFFSQGSGDTAAVLHAAASCDAADIDAAMLALHTSTAASDVTTGRAAMTTTAPTPAAAPVPAATLGPVAAPAPAAMSGPVAAPALTTPVSTYSTSSILSAASAPGKPSLCAAADGAASHDTAATGSVLAGTSLEPVPRDAGDSMRSRLENYDLFEKIGEGSYAVVHRARNRGAGSSNDWPADVAIKIVDEAKMLALQGGHTALPGIDDEIRLWQSLDHPFICKLYETVRDKEGQKVALVMEYCAGGELFDRLSTEGKCTEEEASLIMAELLDALSYMHSKGIVHRDVKPENVCFVAKDRGDDAAPGSGPASIRLVDFGYAAVVQPDAAYGPDWCGTPKYVAPEQVSSTGYESTAPDLWAAGVVLYIMLCGFPPWSASGGPELFEQIEHAQYSFPSPWWDTVSEDAKQLLRGLLTVDPTQRLTASQAAVHPWIETCGGSLQ